MVRYLVVALVLILASVSIGLIFWQQEMKYQLPTPVPSNYKLVSLGQSVRLPEDFNSSTAYFLHFYNPDCPCSRFNSKNVKFLIRSHGDSVRMVIIVPDLSSAKKARNEFGEVDIYVDETNQLALSTGVYSTPQAVIIDQHQKLYYRGNYNKSRYCTSKATNFAELALVALFNHQPSPQFGLLATQSYGCEWDKTNEASLELF